MKIVVWQEGKEIFSQRLYDASVETLLPVLDEYSPEGCAFCSVGHVDAKFLETLRRLMDGRLLLLTSTTPLPVEVRYGSRKTLGADRVAAAVGASSLYPGESLLVADAGTALTLDVVESGTAFAGGNISPGMKLRFASLNQFTESLPLVSPDGDIPEFGNDTVTAIRAGVLRGMVAEIVVAFRQAEKLVGARRIVSAGNDAPLLDGMIRQSGIDVCYDANLVGRGLLEIYLYNTDQMI